MADCIGIEVRKRELEITYINLKRNAKEMAGALERMPEELITELIHQLKVKRIYAEWPAKCRRNYLNPAIEQANSLIVNYN
jgi:hypothetical protein